MLDVNDLSVGYDGREVARLPQCHLGKGEALLLRGPSGSGKTSLLLALAGIAPPLAGTVMIGGTDIYALPEAARDSFRGRHVGVVFQSLHLVKPLTVLQNVLLGGMASGLAHDTARGRDLLSTLGIAALAASPASLISVGQAQRVAIARALMAKPSVILADEPTSSLDDASAASVLDLLTGLCREAGAALVISSHDARLTPHFANVFTLGVAA